MQIKEFEAFNLKECLQQVRNEMGPDAIILETRKFRKGGLMGMGAREAVCIVAATGITVQSDLKTAISASKRSASLEAPASTVRKEMGTPTSDAGSVQEPPVFARPSTAAVAARHTYARKTTLHEAAVESQPAKRETAATGDDFAALLGTPNQNQARQRHAELEEPVKVTKARVMSNLTAVETVNTSAGTRVGAGERRTLPEARPSADGKPPASDHADSTRFTYLERAMSEIRECLAALQREQREGHERTVSAVVSAVAPVMAGGNPAVLPSGADELLQRFPDLAARLKRMGVCDSLMQDLIDELPDLSAWSEQAQEPLAISALKDRIAHRFAGGGGIELTPGKLKAVALIGPTGVGKTTTIAKLAAHFGLIQSKRVALLTVDTYRIAAVEQLKTYSQIIGLPVSVAYNHADVPPIVAQYSDYDLLLIDTAGRSQKHIMQIGELKTLLDTVNCETHLVLGASTKEQDMLEAAHRFAAARVDRIIFSKLDETSTYGTLLNVADQTGIPLSYLTTGQKVPEDIEVARGTALANLLLD